MNDLIDLQPDAFASRLRELGGRGYVVTDHGGTVSPSSEALEPLADMLREDTRDFRGHEGVFLAVGPETGALFGAFVHSTVRGQAQGGLRYWPYARVEDFVRDGLRLSLGMSRKSGLAGLWWGGGKGLIARQEGDAWRDPAFRERLFREYGLFVSSLRGCYITAEDVGTTPPDIALAHASTRFVTCVPPEWGGAGNPSPATAMGVAVAMDAALEALGMGSVAGRTVAVQGAGNVASYLMERLLERGAARIVASDISRDRCDDVRARLGEKVTTRVVAPGDASILAEECDVLAPSALGGILNPETIPTIRAKVVCGAANNQLLDEARDGAALAARGITYVPDFVANRMGIVSCANEQYGAFPDDPAIQRHYGREWDSSIRAVVRRVLERARTEGVTTSAAANAVADESCRVPHPIWGHRGRQIIDGLVASGWGG